MIGTVYIEEAVRRHPRTLQIVARFPGATIVPIDRYSEVFNPRSQDFRVQKASPSLILAEKSAGHVLPTPPGYGISGHRNYYFSHMLNCLYDCRYCFLQGMFNSANYVVFVNFEDFAEAIDVVRSEDDTPAFFFSGFDCDSLAFDGVTGFASSIVPFFAERPDSWLELRTKGTAIDALLAREPIENCVVAWSLSPPSVAEALEHGAPAPEARLRAMERLASAGWKLGVRFDPLIYHEGYERAYADFFAEVFRRLPTASVHSVSLGLFRLPAPFMKKLIRLHPEEPFLAAPLEDSGGVVTVRGDLAEEMRGRCTAALLECIPEELFQPCFSGEASEPGAI